MSKFSLNHYSIPFLLGLCTAIGMLVGYRLDEERITSSGDQVTIDSLMTSSPGKIDELIRYIDARYVDEIDSDHLSDEAIDYLLNRLDPFSSYISPDNIKYYEQQISGRYEGLGVEIVEIKDTFTIFKVYPDGPAAKAEIQVGDQIVSINEHSMLVDSLEKSDLSQLLSSEDGEIQLKLRDSKTQIVKAIAISSGEINVNSIEAAYVLEDSIAYVRLETFTNKSYKEFMTALENLGAGENIDDLIIDLRSNRGGVLRESIQILQQLYEQAGQLLVYTSGDHNRRQDYKTSGKPFYRFDKIAVLINGHSASASEVVAGALQDTDRALVIGEPSYGKGLVQEHYGMKNGGELRLTVARYYTPSGRLIQKPYDHFIPGAVKSETDSTVYQTITGRDVAAEGGITPDVVLRGVDTDRWQDFPDLLVHEVEAYALDLYRGPERASDDWELMILDQSQELEQKYELKPEYSADLHDFMRYTYVALKKGPDSAWAALNESDPMIAQAVDYIHQDRTIVAYLTLLRQ